MEWTGLVLGALALALGGVLKGATGAGSPLFAVPLLAMLYDVPLAVAIFTLPSLFSNLWQGWRFRTHRVGPALTWVFAVAGAAGAAAGSVVLISLSSDLLLLGVAGAVFLYIGVWLAQRSEEHTSGLHSLMRISYDVFGLNKKTHNNNRQRSTPT